MLLMFLFFNYKSIYILFKRAVKVKKQKRTKKNNKFRKNFLYGLTLQSIKAKEEQGFDFIFTDAGFDIIDLELANKCFDYYDILNWWETKVCWEEIDLYPEDFEQLIPTYIDVYNPEVTKQVLEDLIAKYNWLPQEFEVVTAKAFYNFEYQWVEVIELSYGYEENNNFDCYEGKAIQLGKTLKQELERDNLLIVNDNQNAVTTANGIPEFYKWDKFLFKEIEKELINNTSIDIFWMPRKHVTVAHNLSLNQASKIFLPHEY